MSNKNILSIQNKMKDTLDKVRYEHTIGVSYTAAALAMRYGADMEKAQIAGLLHDCAKNMNGTEMLAMCYRNHIPCSDMEVRNPSLLHAKLGGYLAENTYQIKDTEILKAITLHTTGAPEMTLLDKIIYVADFIEPNRDKVPSLNIIRKVVFEDINKGMRMIMESTLQYLNQLEADIDPMTVRAYEYYRSKEDI